MGYLLCTWGWVARARNAFDRLLEAC